MFSKKANSIFNKTIESYKILDDINQPFVNQFNKEKDLISHLLFRKCWIDTVQWAYEDLIRDPNIDPNEALTLKRRIDASNQERTDTVENIDSYFFDKFRTVSPKEDATVNTESPAWAIDRLSILALKIYHMQLETIRSDASSAHKRACNEKLNILIQQRQDLSTAIDSLIDDISKGNKYMKVYKQMKMYNDDELNPVLRKIK